uniref:Uncharacterized protein n=1 Tax=Anser cygnoides TaxID=8845 RepID=A0A8B9DSV0_ANSCY
MTTSQVHQNCHHECKATVNGAAIAELHAAYVCLFIALHFKRDDVAVPHLRCFFQERVCEEQEWAEDTLPRGGAPSLELFKTRLDEALGNLI